MDGPTCGRPVATAMRGVTTVPPPMPSRPDAKPARQPVASRKMSEEALSGRSCATSRVLQSSGAEGARAVTVPAGTAPAVMAPSGLGEDPVVVVRGSEGPWVSAALVEVL